MSEIEITHTQGIVTVAKRKFDLNKIDRELQGKDELMANQEEILKDVKTELARRRTNILEDRVLVRVLAETLEVDSSTLLKRIKSLEIPVYNIRIAVGNSMQVCSAVDSGGALQLAVYYGGGDISDDSTGGQSEDTPSD